ncbi:MAG TPA: hypothetical protein VFE58_04835 [Tepidisphaeraceae bacterium]|nr:hypothetical protein [Tepidisphaeraceae bacterium]
MKSNYPSVRTSTRNKLNNTTRRKTALQKALFEGLENRCLFSYTFDLVGNAASATGDASTDSLVIAPIGGLLEHSVNGGAFSSDWNGNTVPASNTITVTVNLTTGDGSSFQLGSGADAASNSNAHFVVIAPANTSDTAGIDDSQGASAGTYTYDTSAGTISGPGIDYNESSSNPFTGGVTIVGSPADGNTFNITSVLAGEPANIMTAAGTGANTINVGSSNVLNVNAPLVLSGNGNATTVNINDSSDTANSTATFDNLSPNSGAPFELTGLSASPIEYTGLNALNVNGGTFNTSGVIYNVNNTTSDTTLTISGGPNQNFINLSNSGETAGLDNLPGPVVVLGGSSSTDVVTLDDSGADFNDAYTVTSTTVSRPVFGGLTYDDNIGTLTLNAENTLGMDGNNTITVTSTANSITTNINSQGGADTITVNGTGNLGVLNITTAGDNSNVNVIADNEAVDISINGAGGTINLGSSGGAGTMENILNGVSITDGPAFYDLNFHDESDTNGHTWTLNNDDVGNTASVALSSGIATTSYRPGDIESVTINAGSGGNTFAVNNTTATVPTTLNTGTGNDTVNVLANGNNTLNINGQDGADAVTLGGAPSAGMQNLNATINITNAANFTDVTLDDSQNSSARTATIDDNGTTNTITGLSPATINLTDSEIGNLTINGGTGGNGFTVNNNGPFSTTINKGAGNNNTVTVLGTNVDGTLTLTGTGMDDTVTLGNGSLINLAGPVNIQEAPGSTNLVLDFSSDTMLHDFVLSGDGTTSTLHDNLGNLPHDITFLTASLASFTIEATPDFNENLTVDFGQGGNPIPSAGSGLIFNGGNGTGSHGLILTGGLSSPFASETHTANDSSVSPQFGQFGTISFNDGLGNANSATMITYTGLQPITDTVPVSIYTFNDAATDPSFTAQNGPVVSGFNTIEFVNTPTAPPPTFETTDVSNKASIIFNAITDQGLNGVVDISVPSDGLTSLTFNTPNSHEDAVHFLNTPSGIATALVGGSDEDTTTVTGTGVSSGTTLLLNGGAGVDTLNYDAGGLVPTITAGGVAGEILISIPGAGTIDAFDYANINITNITPLVITPATAVTIHTVEGTPLTNQIVGTFTAPILATPAPAGYPASDFLVSINWGDGTIAAGTVVQDPSNPSVYDIIGNHTYAAAGTFSIGNTVSFVGGTYTSSLNGVSLAVTAPASPNTNVTAGSAVVTQGAISLTAFPVVGTEGIAIPAAPVATFTQAGTQEPVGSYTATISAINSSGVTVFTVAAASITLNGTLYTVNAPALTFPDEGNYRLVVAVTETASSTTAVASSQATIADAPLTATSGAALTPNTGIAFTGLTVGTFTDADPTAPVSDFTAIINWGDGTSSAGTITQPGGVGTPFRVTGSHIYMTPGTYSTLINVLDDGGSATTLAGSAAVTDLAVTGTGNSFSVVQNQSTGDIVLATFSDPNPFATASSITATIPAGGWGDGSPAAPMLLTVVPVGSTSTSTLFEIVGSHTYAHVGTFPVNITVRTAGGAVTNLTATATVTTPAPHLVFYRTPQTVVAGKIIAPFIIVYAEDSTGNLIKTDHSTVTLSMNTGPAGGYLTGGRTATLANGVAIFSKVTIKKAGVYTIQASDGTDTAAISKKLSVVPAALKMVFTIQPRSGLAGNPFSTQVRLVDKFGNLATTDKSKVTLSLANHPAGASFSPITVTVDDGIAEFDHLILKTVGQYQFLATDYKDKLPNRNSSKFTMHSAIIPD